MKVYELLDSPEKHIKNEWAQNAEGKSVLVNDPTAVKFCLIGAIWRRYPDPDPIRQKVLNELINQKIFLTPAQFNDSTTYEKVIQLCRKLDI